MACHRSQQTESQDFSASEPNDMINQRVKHKMIFLFVLVAVLSVSVFSVIALNARRKNPPQQPSQQRILELEEKEKHHQLSLAELAQLTTARGENRAILQGVPVLYPGAQDPEELDQILSKYTIIVGELIMEKGYVGEREKITSWCKFRVLDTIAQVPPLNSFASRAIPSDFPPIAEGEFVVPRLDGVITIDGVEIVQYELAVEEFRRSQKYLMLLSLDPVTKIAELALGPQSVLPIKEDGTLDSRQQEHILQRALTVHHRGSIGQLKIDLNK
jgi:hypothetical protein